ncbi:MAG TPA: zf-HC2 domain-containing protein [Candidatus Eisenbacteria bacterium]|nr:zf-HC2 domain-containing protein [Candidatus Eisenbacteria bacterium]
MSCQHMEGRILGYLDGRLKESERLEVERHISNCPPCRLRVQEFTAVSGLLDELPVMEPSPEFDTRVHALVAAEPAPQQSWWAWLHVQPRIALAACLLVVMAVWVEHRSTPVTPLPANDDQAMLQDLPVLEDHDVLQNFEPLKELPAPVQDEGSNEAQPQQQPQQQDQTQPRPQPQQQPM